MIKVDACMHTYIHNAHVHNHTKILAVDHHDVLTLIYLQTHCYCKALLNGSSFCICLYVCFFRDFLVSFFPFCGNVSLIDERYPFYNKMGNELLWKESLGRKLRTRSRLISGKSTDKSWRSRQLFPLQYPWPHTS